MRNFQTLAALAAVLVLSACLDTDLERGAVGAGAGMLAADLLDGNILTGAALGAVAGVVCDDVRVCTPAR